MNRDKFVNQRFFWLWCAVIITWSVLGARLWYLQVVKGDHYHRLSAQNYTRIMEISAPRGRVYDRNGELILGNRPFYDLVVIPQFVSDPSKTSSQLESLFGLSAEETEQKISRRSHPKFLPITLKRNLTLHQRSLVESAKMVMPGVHITKNVRRDYTSNPPAHVVGYLSKPSQKHITELQKKHPDKSYQPTDYVGQYGLEKVWEPYLRGREGKQLLQVDAHGQRVDDPAMQIPVPQVPAISGHHLILTMDKELQKIAEEAFSHKTGAVVVIDARDGGILAMVSSPSYPADLYQSRISENRWNKLLSDPKRPLFDKTTGAEYAPGSTFKVIMALAGLQEALIDSTTKFHCPGWWRRGNRTFHCHKRGGHGEVDLRGAISQSCNVFFYELSLQLGIEKMAEYARLFQLGKWLGLPLNHESPGLIPSPLWKSQLLDQPWHFGETPLVAVGQGPTLITPLQLASLYGIIGTSGWVLRPYLVSKVVSRLGKTIYRRESQPPKRIEVIERRHFQTVQEALQATVDDEHGTGTRARVAGADIAGKTGTVQVVRMKRNQDRTSLFAHENKASHKKDHAIFAAFYPAHAAEIAIAVVSQNDDEGGGGRAAAPVAQKILAGYIKQKQR